MAGDFDLALPYADHATSLRTGSKTADETTSPLGASLLERLPTELKRQILSYVVPSGLTISFAQCPSRYWWRKLSWCVDTRRTGIAGESTALTNMQSEDAEPPHLKQCAYQSLVRTSKTLSAEAQAMMYSNNEFLLRTKMPLPGGNFGPLPPHVLRDIKTIRLVLEKDVHSYLYKRLDVHENFLRRFVMAINENSEDACRRSLLKQFDIEFKTTAGKRDYKYGFNTTELNELGDSHWIDSQNQTAAACMYTLEVLTELPKIEKVGITGTPAWFAECLALCIRGKGGQVLPLRWQKQRMKNKNGVPRYRSMRPETAPSLDWAEFAERNGIELPDRMVAFFQKHSARWPRLELQAVAETKK